MKAIRLKTPTEIKNYCLSLGKKNDKMRKVTESAEAFGTFSTYYIDNVPVLQHDIPKTGIAKVYKLIGYPKYSVIKPLMVTTPSLAWD